MLCGRRAVGQGDISDLLSSKQIGLLSARHLILVSFSLLYASHVQHVCVCSSSNTTTGHVWMELKCVSDSMGQSFFGLGGACLSDALWRVCLVVGGRAVSPTLISPRDTSCQIPGICCA